MRQHDRRPLRAGTLLRRHDLSNRRQAFPREPQPHAVEVRPHHQVERRPVRRPLRRRRRHPPHAHALAPVPAHERERRARDRSIPADARPGRHRPRPLSADEKKKTRDMECGGKGPPLSYSRADSKAAALPPHSTCAASIPHAACFAAPPLYRRTTGTSSVRNASRNAASSSGVARA